MKNHPQRIIFIHLLALLLGVWCSACSFQEFASCTVLPSVQGVEISLDSGSSQDYVDGSAKPIEKPFVLFLLEIEETNQSEKTKEDEKDSQSLANGLHLQGTPESAPANKAPLSLPIGASCQSVKKFILLHSFKLDC